MRTELAVVGVSVLLLATAFGASAFTTASVDRSASISVVQDQNALVGLEDGGTGNLVNETANGKLTIDTAHLTTADGLNTNATFTLGNVSTSDGSLSKSNAAFLVVNNDDKTHGYRFSFTDGDSTSGEVTFEIYYIDASSAVHTITVSDGSGSATLSDIPAGQEVYATVTIDTHDTAASETITGTLNVTATA